MSKKYTTSLTIFGAFLLFVSIACRFFDRVADIPDETIPVTTEAVEGLKTEIITALDQARKTGEIILAIDEAELTSLIALELEKEADIPLSDPQVFLRDGQVLITGNLTQDGITLPVSLVLSVMVRDGQPVFQVETASLGSLPLPQQLIDQLSDQIDAILSDYLRSQAGDFTFKSITIADGVMSIVGLLK